MPIWSGEGGWRACEGLRACCYVGWSEGPKQLNLESLRVHDRIKSKPSSDHCSPNILSYSRLPLYSCPTRALLETLYLQVCYMCLIYKCKIVFVACNEIAFCFIYIVGSLGTVAQGNDSVSNQAKVTLCLLHACIKYVLLQILDCIYCN